MLAPCERTRPTGDGEEGGVTVAARVVEVVDGDTIVAEIAGGEREDVRYIGVDTPESNPAEPIECFGHEAERANARLVGGREVMLEVGPESRDDYGRLLAFVRVRGAGGKGGGEGRKVLVNAELVRRGYARALTIAPNDLLAPLFERLEAEAGRAGRGLWGACIT
jgi:micrococcal nuclease